MSEATIVFLVLGATVALFVWNRLPVIVVAVGSAVALHLTGVLTLKEALAGFGDPVIAFVAALFIVTAGLEATGVTTWVGRQVERIVAGSRTRLLVVGMLAVAALCPLINASGAVGALLPVVMLLVVRLGDDPSRLLMPIAFAAGAGSHLALTGSPKNVLIADAVADAGAGAIGFFDFALVGLPLLGGTVAIVLLFGRRLVPRRAPASLPPDLSRYAETMVEQYRLAADVFRLKIRRGSPLAGSRATALDLGPYPGLRLVSATDGRGAPRLARPLSAGDFLVLRGDAAAAERLAAALDLKLEAISRERAARNLVNRNAGVAEAVIPPRSRFVGQTVFPGMVTSTGDVVILAVQRGGEAVEGETTLQAGDHVLVQGGWDTIDARSAMPGVLLVATPAELKRQTVALGVGAKAMLAVTAAMVAAIAGGLVAPAVAALAAAGATLTLGMVSVERAYRAINWTTVILMAGMFPLSTAIEHSGAAAMIADGLVDVAGRGSPRLLLACVFGIGVLLGAIISNTATCLILIPIATISAASFGVSPAPALMCLSVATSASFLTPVSTPVNTMVMGPAGYRFGDYWRLGLPLTALYGLVAIWLVPLIWPF
ncbi:SLC13 family permease [Amaricoccus sp.]|uniref:SLC13 family permease n=1 Tax=Amaricoccus sp. TaxID=1872485 RepID=UPI001B51DB93|nr:SLC13 family permease [Amaricoccus sp.]MBP7001008.1 SLC13 family permease [Amaricoccus sp.]